jgi:hypothetical protein
MVKITKANGDVWELSVEELNKLENNTKVSVSKEEPLLIVPKVRKIRKTVGKWSSWTSEEDKIVKSNHNTKVMKKLLPGRTLMAIRSRIKVLRGRGAKIKLEITRTKKRAKYTIKPTDKRIPMMKAVNQIVKELKIKYPYTETNELRKLAFKVYKDNQPKTEVSKAQ